MKPRDRFAVNLRRLREKRGISQEELGDLCGLHRTEVSLLERGGREPRLATLVKLATALDASVADLSNGISWNPAKLRFEFKAL